MSVARPEGVSSACFVPKALGRAFCGDNPEGAPPSFPRRTNGNTDGERKEKNMTNTTKFHTACLLAATAILASGCASTGGSDKTDGVQAEFQKWASKRAPVEQVVSKSSDPQVAAIVNGVAVIPGEVYGYLAEGSDKAMARNAGRDIYEAIMRDKNAGTSIEDIRKAVSDADWSAAADYAKFVKSQDYASLGQKLSGIAAKLATDGAKVGGAVAAIRDLDSMKGKNPIALAAAMKEPTAEINTIKAQLADAVKACTYWQDLNKQDEMAQKFMKDYPIEK